MLLRRKGRTVTNKDSMSKLDIRSYDIYYQILLGLVSQGILKSERMPYILEFLDNIDADLERITLVKNTLSEFSLDNYKNAGKSAESIRELMKTINSNINKIYFLKNVILEVNFRYYKGTVKSLRNLFRELSVTGRC